MAQVSLPPVRKQVLKALLHTAILVKLRNEPSSGYDLLLSFNEEFGIILSPGTVYATLISMDRDGLITSELDHRKRVYELTDEGKIALKELLKDVKKLDLFIRRLLMPED